MTPTQLKAFATVVRLGSVKAAADELGVSEAAVSMHVAHLRRELEDDLFTRTSSGLAFTPGGLRLASRAVEILGLQDRTVLEVGQARSGRRLLRLGVSRLFAEHAAPGLIELFTGRAADLDVELSVHPSGALPGLLLARTLDLAIGPAPARTGSHAPLVAKPFLNYEVVCVAAPGHPLTGHEVGSRQLREQRWLLGPSAADDQGVVPDLLHRLQVPESRQTIFQSDAAALAEARRSAGLSLSVAFALVDDLARGRLARVDLPGGRLCGTWTALTLPAHNQLPAAAELLRFITTPRATQAMVHGSGARAGHFRPSVHVTLWS